MRDYHFRVSSMEEKCQWVNAFCSVIPSESMPLDQTRSSNHKLESNINLLQLYWKTEGPVHKQSEAISQYLRTHPSVFCISIRKSYVLAQPYRGEILRDLRELDQKIKQRWPNQRMALIWNESIKSLGGVHYQLGQVDVHRCLDLSTPHIVCWSTDDNTLHNSDYLHSNGVVFSLLKSLSFPRKLNLLDQLSKQNGKSFSMNLDELMPKVVLAACSDILMEFEVHFSAHAVDWSDLTNSISTLYMLVQHPFKARGMIYFSIYIKLFMAFLD